MIKNTIENFKPNLIVLGHADRVKPETLYDAKKIFPHLKICQWFLDPLSKKGPDYQKNRERLLDKNSICSLVEMKPITGRKHQLRKQLSYIGHPIYGDQKYNLGYRQKGSNKNLMLHSYQIKFMIKGHKFTYTALLPDYFKKLLKIKKLNFLNC